MAKRTLLGTLTGENYQPVRLHYEVLDQAGLQRAFQVIRCLAHDPTQRRWAWLYDHEARERRFKRSYAELPEQARPVVLGSFYLRDDDQLLLILLSCERATLAVPFFDKHIPRSVARVTEADVVNRLFSTEDRTLTPESHFEHPPSTLIRPQDAVERARELAAGIWNPMKRLKVMMAELDAAARRPLPEIERLPVHYYEDGIDGFALGLKLRQIMAMEHWLGNTKFTMADAIKLVTKAT